MKIDSVFSKIKNDKVQKLIIDVSNNGGGNSAIGNLIIDYLTEIGIKRENIFDSNICSVCNVANMYSYRAEKEKSDRNMNIVMLK